MATKTLEADSRTAGVLRLLDSRVAQSGTWAWWMTFITALLVYGATAHWTTGQITDAIVASWPGWHFVRTGSLDLAGVDLPQFPGLLQYDERVVVARTMGVVLAGIPGAAFLAWADASPEVSGALSAVLMTSLAVANVGLALRSLVPSRVAILGSGVLALGTGMWTIASAELWGHGPAALWLSCALLAVSRRQWWWAGLAMAPAIMTRPHLALAAAVVGLWLGASHRSLRPVIAIGIPSAAAVALLHRWNAWYFRRSGVDSGSSLDSGYGYAFGNATRGPLDGLALWLENLAGVLVSPMSGLLLYTPVTLVALAAAVRHRREAPSWTRALAAGGAVHLLLQMRISPNFDGGASYFGNRYTIETLVLLTPMFVFCLHRWAVVRPARLRVIGVLSAASVGTYLYGAVLVWWWVPIRPRSSWEVWYPYDVATYAGPAAIGAAVAALGLVALTAAAVRPLPQVSLPLPASPAAEEHIPSSAPPAARPGAAASRRR